MADETLPVLEKVIVHPAMEARAREMFPGVLIEVDRALCDEDKDRMLAVYAVTPPAYRQLDQPIGVRNPPADEHPLPWRWEAVADSSGARVVLLDANGDELIGARRFGGGNGSINGGSPYVRAVTERAGAMEKLLRKHQWSDSRDGFPCCPECNGFEPSIEPVPGAGGHAAYCAVGTLLAEIDAAKAGGG